MARNFPLNPVDNDTFEGYIYSETDDVWRLESSVFATESYVNTRVNTKISNSEKGADLGVATLDGDGNVTIDELAHIIDSAPSNLNTLGKLSNQFNKHTESQWASVTGILPMGSINLEENVLDGTFKIKIGDGNKTWDELSYVVDSSYVDSVTDPIATDVADLQTDKASLAGATFSGDVTIDGYLSAPHVTDLAGITQTELGYLEGVTSSIQTQIDEKFDLADANGLAYANSQVFTGNISLPYTTTIGTISPEEINALDGVSTSTTIQYQVNQLDGRLDSTESDIQGLLDTYAVKDSPTFTGTVSGITKSMVGLANVDNTSDANKPVSTATQTELDLKAPLADPIFTGTLEAENVTIDGDLTVTGTTTTVNATNLEVTDSLIYLSADQYDADVLDIGIFGAYGDSNSGHFHTGLIRDASDSKWKLVSNGPEPTSNTIDFTGITYDTLKVGGIEFSDGTQTKEGIPSLTSFVYKTASYTLDSLSLRDQVIEVSSSSPTTITIPLDSTIDYPIGTSIDILQTSTGQVTIDKISGVTMNGTPGFKLRTQWSSATILKRAANTWIVYGDLAL